MKDFGVFFIFMATAMLLMNYYILRGFILLLELNGFWIKTLTILLGIVFISQLVFAFSFRYDFLPTWAYVFTASMIGVSFMLFSFTFIYDLFYISIAKVGVDEERREFLKKALTFSSLALVFVYIFRGFWGGFRNPIIKNQHVKIKNLKNDLNIVQISDAHIGKYLNYEYLKYLVSKTNELKPDIVAITGDLVDWKLEDLKDTLQELKNLKSTYGTFYVAGNHEYYHGVDEILEFIESLGIKVLRNESQIVGNINLAGIYDIASFRLKHRFKPNLEKTLSKIDKNLPTILLAHQPKAIEEFDDKTPVDLVLSGHTHGGQIFPFGLLVRLAQPYLYGLYKHNEKTQIYVSSGAGFWGPPVRFLAPSEIVSIKLTQVS